MDSESARHIHAITPGDHFSPLTGSAVPTVVHGLAGARPQPRPAVLVARGTYPDRYASADVIEYEARSSRLPAERYIDLACGRLGYTRPGQARSWRAVLAAQHSWAPAVVLGHNAPQLVGQVDHRHRAVLYAHNDILRSYGTREAGRALDTVDRIVCVSDYLADQVSGHLPAALVRRVRVVGNGVDTRLFAPDAGARDAGIMTVLFIGRTIPDKGPDVLLEAVARAGRDDIQVVVVGSHGFDPAAALTDYERSLRRTAEPIRPAVRFLPFVPRAQVPDLYRTADVLVVPSRWPDPCPLTLGEGTASGLAVVASSIGGIAQSLGGAGVLVPPGDSGALADVLAGLAADAGERARIGARARAHALGHDWTWSARRLDEALAG